ncbi:uncharacterized protein LOC132163065 [Corylus avellana]|uniref:uncharacterized protein LOC132163065 n=1 Tax=Corylus avellana TaxID=13451 RepID=UPI00286CF530|nr:uncharacterized protein LOC132163065 [Corylus avellana]
MATSIPNSSKAMPISLKLLVDNNSNKVLFAEAGKEFVDFLFGLIHIPIGSIMGLFRSHGIAVPGSWSKVYESIQDLDSTCLHQSKEKFLMPEPAFPSDTHPPPLLLNFVPPKQEYRTTTVLFGVPTPTGLFGVPTSENRSVVQRKETGYVRGVVTLTFMVMDDLTVKPMSTISSITLLNTLNVKDVGLLQEKTVTVDIQKGLELVKASFESTTVLTDVFLGHTELRHSTKPISGYNCLGGGFSEGAGGRDKSGRKIVKVIRKGRKK